MRGLKASVLEPRIWKYVSRRQRLKECLTYVQLIRGTQEVVRQPCGDRQIAEGTAILLKNFSFLSILKALNYS